MNHLKSYNEFILEELVKLTSSSSRSGRTKEVSLIHDIPETPKSPSALDLLNQKLREEEFKELLDTLSDNKFDKSPVNKINKSSRRQRMQDELKVTINNLMFLKDKQRELGTLYCEYCSKGPLKIYDFKWDGVSVEDLMNQKWRLNSKFNKNDGATVDHKQPQSKHGDKFDYKNLAVCCWDCNNEKGNKSWNEWRAYLKYKQED